MGSSIAQLPSVTTLINNSRFEIENPTGSFHITWASLRTLIETTIGGQIEMQSTLTHIQYRRIGTATWINLVPLENIRGQQGTGLTILGQLSNPSELPADGEPGNGYIIGSNLWVWVEDTEEWINVGPVAGPPGANGQTPELSIDDNDEWIRWRYIGETDWTNLVNVEAMIPSYLLGAMRMQGTWDASLGDPPDADPQLGWYWIVTTAGTTALSGIDDWAVSDWAVFTAGGWRKIDNSESVVSFNGRTGPVMPANGDYSYAQISGTPTLHEVATSGSYNDLEDLPTLGTAAAVDLGEPEGACPLDLDGKIPTEFMPVSSLVYQGAWNAATNTPTLENATPSTPGFFWRVSVPGTVDFGAGDIEFALGDWVVFEDATSTYQKMTFTDEVTSVNGQTGAVELNAANIPMTGDVGAPTIEEYLDNNLPTSVVNTGSIATAASVLALEIGNILIGVRYIDGTEVEYFAHTVDGADEVIDLRQKVTTATGVVLTAHNNVTLDEIDLVLGTSDQLDSEAEYAWTLYHAGRVWEINSLISFNGARASMWANNVI